MPVRDRLSRGKTLSPLLCGLLLLPVTLPARRSRMLVESNGQLSEYHTDLRQRSSVPSFGSIIYFVRTVGTGGWTPKDSAYTSLAEKESKMQVRTVAVLVGVAVTPTGMLTLVTLTMWLKGLA